jgi:ketosteroid isomerase-like protein
MRRETVVLALGTLLVVTLAQVARAGSPPGEEAAIQAVLDAQVLAWNSGDLEGYMKGYWRSPELSFFGGGERTRGYDETLARYRRRYKAEGRAMGKLSFSELGIEVVSSDAAIVRGTWHLVLPDGKRPQGLFTLVLRRKPDGWRIVHDHSSSAS